ncbi:MAG: hypothetical protein M1840_003266 [Geoglossum simile]|nr:MAG: hypothetical protein M1840_003266 [Geoglossum simile]
MFGLANALALSDMTSIRPVPSPMRVITLQRRVPNFKCGEERLISCRSRVVQYSGAAGDTSSIGSLNIREGQEEICQDNSGHRSLSIPGVPAAENQVVRTYNRQRADARRVGSAIPLEETEKWAKWLEEICDREWLPYLKDSWYRDIISGLHTIVEKAKPAGAESVLSLTMHDARGKLERGGIAQPILIKGDANTTIVIGRNIPAFLEQLQCYHKTVAVQDLSFSREKGSGERWNIGDVVGRFSGGSRYRHTPF